MRIMPIITLAVLVAAVLVTVFAPQGPALGQVVALCALTLSMLVVADVLTDRH